MIHERTNSEVHETAGRSSSSKQTKAKVPGQLAPTTEVHDFEFINDVAKKEGITSFTPIESCSRRIGQECSCHKHWTDFADSQFDDAHRLKRKVLGHRDTFLRAYSLKS